ncbi:hypothetical protein RQP46_000111 [Phenoliferia psychrophenolica]
MSLPVLSFGPLSAAQSSAAIPPFAHHSPAVPDAAADSSAPSFAHVARAVLKAKRIAIVCGAGISCASGIPDFRSADGLFENLKRAHPSAKLNSGKDLFDASLFTSETNSAIFYTMIAELKTMADEASPTAFHRFLKALDDEGKLFRVYTQNIDGLEEKAGLSYGLGNRSTPIPAPRSRKVLPPAPAPAPAPPSSLPLSTRTRSNSPSTPPSSSSSPPPTPGLLDPAGIPRCIPLHGHLSTLSCPACSHSLPITPHLPLLSSGSTLPCPSCLETDTTRRSLGDRSRGVGRMKPDVVLYGEAHPEGERVGEITRRDLMGPRPDLLLVVGTSLKVPGTKLLVRELAKVIRPLEKDVKEEGIDDDTEMPISSASTTASSSTTSSQRRKKSAPKPKPVHAIYLNLDFPTPSREFKDVFDIWLRGDVQTFVEQLEVERRAEQTTLELRRVERENRERRKSLKDHFASSKPTSSSSASSSAATSKKPTSAAAAKKRPSPTPSSTAPPTKAKAKAKKPKYSATSAMHAKKTTTPAGATQALRENSAKATTTVSRSSTRGLGRGLSPVEPIPVVLPNPLIPEVPKPSGSPGIHLFLNATKAGVMAGGGGGGGGKRTRY